MTTTPRIPAEDLPQMWQKPAFTDILVALQSLRVEPPIWKWNSKQSDLGIQESLKQDVLRDADQQAVARYLSSIISSPLSWLQDDDQKDLLWTEAGRRLSERCGRAAMGEITRSWPFEGEGVYPQFELSIREPPLTGDSLGLKTWGSSYALACMLHQFPAGPLRHLLPQTRTASSPPVRVLELGSGTGLLGLAAAAIWGCHVTLSDLPEIMPNLCHNADRNREIVEEMGGSLAAGALTWGGQGDDQIDPDLFADKNQFKVCVCSRPGLHLETGQIAIVADPMYDDDHPGLLAGAIDQQLSLDSDARALVMVPQRDATTIGLLSSFRKAMEQGVKNPFVCNEEGVVDSQDDWGDVNKDEAQENIKCWWGVFRRI